MILYKLEAFNMSQLKKPTPESLNPSPQARRDFNEKVNRQAAENAKIL